MPPKATAKRSAPPLASRDTTLAKPTADYDGFNTGVQDEPVAKLPDLPRTTTNRPKPRKEPGGVAGQPPADSAEDEQLRRKLTICRDCK